jgi:predicted TIM-barrel fold metal-dependent hydrolase
MPQERIVSADSHVIEPPDVWTARIEHRFADRAPHVVKEFNGHAGDYFVAEGMQPLAIAAFAVAGVNPREFKHKMREGYANVRPGGWDPVERIKDQDRDGVTAEVIYPSFGMRLFQLEDGELRKACFRAYNDWLAEYCSYDPHRLAGIATIALDDPVTGTEELARVAAKGLKGAMIWGEAPAEAPYNDPVYDRFWAVAQDAGVPISLHVVTERRSTPAPDPKKVSIMKHYVTMHHGIERSLVDLILGGVLERFPKLKIVSVENDIGWIPHLLQRADHAYDRYRFLERDGAVPNPPSYYFRRQVYATFQDDRVGIVTRELVGVANLMWASDYPHSDSTWPNSQEVIARDFAGVSEHDRRMITADNAAALYGVG